jgi:hypothetical protein
MNRRAFMAAIGGAAAGGFAQRSQRPQRSQSPSLSYTYTTYSVSFCISRQMLGDPTSKALQDMARKAAEEFRRFSLCSL